MTTIGTVESVWRYPVKSMSGEALAEAFMGFSGFYGDRCFAFHNSAASKGFPYLTARGSKKCCAIVHGFVTLTRQRNRRI